MHAISRRFAPEQAAAMAVKAGADVVLDPPDPEAAYRGIREAAERGEIPLDQIDGSVRRILRAKARLGLHKSREVDLRAIPIELGGRGRAALADEISARALTLVKDERKQLPVSARPDARVLYLSLIDYASGWREGAPSRAFLPELKRRFSDVTAVEISDRTTAAEMDLVRALGRGADLVIASTFVRIASYSGRMDLTPEQVSLLEELAADEKRPFVVVAFGSPYLPMLAPRLPAVLLTYELTEAAEAAAVRALLGGAPIGGKLPISLPGFFPVGHGLPR
jgi:beta-N-acetylhexosaminidase